MLYRFSSRAAATLIMQQAPAEQLLQALGKEITNEGIFDACQLPQAISTLNLLLQTPEQPAIETIQNTNTTDEKIEPIVSVHLSQRIVPLIKHFELALQAKEPVIWRRS